MQLENIEIKLPESKRGRQSEEQKQVYNRDLEQFALDLIQLSDINKEAMIKANIISKYEGYKVSSRGWCYILEGFHTITKDQFDLCEKTINICRKNGLLPIDFTAYDKNREFQNDEKIVVEYKNPHEYITEYLEYIYHIEEMKDDTSFWETQEYYIQMMVEKIDILNLFQNICEKYHIRIANAKGWSDIGSRNDLAQRFKESESIGLKPVLLYYGDFDPAGILITNKIKKNLRDISLGTKWNPDRLIVDRFGLEFDFIEKHNLMWIDNLITGSGKKADERKDYVRDYITKYGRRKCEANAILPIADIAVEQCEETILKYLTKDCFTKYDEKINERQKEVLELMKNVEYKEIIQELIENIENQEIKS